MIHLGIAYSICNFISKSIHNIIIWKQNIYNWLINWFEMQHLVFLARLESFRLFTLLLNDDKPIQKHHKQFLQA